MTHPFAVSRPVTTPGATPSAIARQGSTVTACVINYNGERYLPGSLAALVAEHDRLADIVLVDDASLDASVGLARGRFPGIRVVQLDTNRGAAAARNAALRAARTDRVLLVDNDVVLAPRCLEELTRALEEHPEVAIVVPTVLYADRPAVVQWAGAGSHYLGLQTPEGEFPLAHLRDGVRPITSLITACFLLDRSRLVSPQTFDETFFMVHEDHDFGVRVRAHGGQMALVPTARCYHGAGTAGLSVRLMKGYSDRKARLLIRNRWRFIAKVYRLRSLAVLAPMLLVFELAQLAVAIEKGWGRQWLGALASTLRDWRTLLRLRQEFQRGRCLPDRTLFEGGRLPFRPELTTTGPERVTKHWLDVVAQAYWRWAGGLL